MNITEKRRAEEFIANAVHSQKIALVNGAHDLPQPAKVTNALSAIAKQINLIAREGYELEYFRAYSGQAAELTAGVDISKNKAWKKANTAYGDKRTRISVAAKALNERVWADDIDMPGVLKVIKKGL